jgi:hypothetical protein
MGWSCRKEVGDTLDKLQQSCVLSTGMSNVWVCMGTRYMFELDRKEYADGHATGEVLKFGPSPNENMATLVGRFNVRPDGALTKSSHGAMHDLLWVMQ